MRGSQVLGRYPEILIDNDENPLSIGRGRLIPTTPWEALWRPIAQWLGVEDERDLADVLPNAANFPRATLYDQLDLFEP